MQPKICIPRMLCKRKKRLMRLSALSSLQLPRPPRARREGNLKSMLIEGNVEAQRKDLPRALRVE